MRARRYFYYLRFAGCETVAQLDRVSEATSALGVVRDRGLGTAKDPKSAWVELGAKDHLASIAAVRQGLGLLALGPEDVPEIVEIERGEGSTQAKQLDLFAGASC